MLDAFHLSLYFDTISKSSLGKTYHSLGKTYHSLGKTYHSLFHSHDLVISSFLHLLFNHLCILHPFPPIAFSLQGDKKYSKRLHLVKMSMLRTFASQFCPGLYPPSCSSLSGPVSHVPFLHAFLPASGFPAVASPAMQPAPAVHAQSFETAADCMY